MNTIGAKIASHTKRLIVWQFLCVCVPVIALFLLPSKQIWEHREHYQTTFDETAQAITRVKASAIGEKIALVGADALSLSTQASEFFTYSDRFSNNAVFHRDGALYKNEQKKPFAFYTSVELNQEARKKAGRLLLLLPLLESQVKSLPVSSGFVYLEDPFMLVYPPISSVDENNTDEPLYEVFRRNPRKQWRLSINDGLKIAAPVFAASRPIGIAGFNLSKETLFAEALSDIPTPQGGFAFIADAQNKTVLFGSASSGFNEQSYFSGVSQIGFKLIEQNIEGAPITLVYGAPIDEIGAEETGLYQRLMYVAAIIGASILLFYLLFGLRSARTTKALTESITRPLDMVARFSYRLGTRKADRIVPMGVTEFDDFANHMRLIHSKLLPSLIIDEETGLCNRRALLEDLEGKGPFGLIVLGVHFRCDNDALYIAAANYVLKRCGEFAGRVISGGDSIYLAGANRLAILTYTEERESLRAIAKKIVDMIDNGSFEFYDIQLKASAIFGVATSDKNINGEKLIASAEAEALKNLAFQSEQQ
jgi:GGDEF domain-containing protein